MQVYNKILHRILYENDEWMIYDGDGKNLSTNGTWLFLDTHYPLENDSLFKSGQTLFKVTLIEKP